MAAYGHVDIVRYGLLARFSITVGDSANAFTHHLAYCFINGPIGGYGAAINLGYRLGYGVVPEVECSLDHIYVITLQYGSYALNSELYLPWLCLCMANCFLGCFKVYLFASYNGIGNRFSYGSVNFFLVRANHGHKVNCMCLRKQAKGCCPSLAKLFCILV